MPPMQPESRFARAKPAGLPGTAHRGQVRTAQIENQFDAPILPPPPAWRLQRRCITFPTAACRPAHRLRPQSAIGNRQSAAEQSPAPRHRTIGSLFFCLTRSPRDVLAHRAAVVRRSARLSTQDDSSPVNPVPASWHRCGRSVSATGEEGSAHSALGAVRLTPEPSARAGVPPTPTESSTGTARSVGLALRLTWRETPAAALPAAPLRPVLK
jgi:hypothetical protein